MDAIYVVAWPEVACGRRVRKKAMDHACCEHGHGGTIEPGQIELTLGPSGVTVMFMCCSRCTAMRIRKKTPLSAEPQHGRAMFCMPALHTIVQP